MSRLFLIVSLPLVLIAFSGTTVLSVQDQPQPKPEVKKIDIDEFDTMRQGKDAVVLDVRTKQEFAEGHVPGAVNIDISDPQFRKKVGELDKSKTYLVHCARGVRSARATKAMSAMGFDRLFDFHGGFEAWKKSGKPIEK